VGVSSAVTYYTYNTLPGDANGDGTVSFEDFIILANGFGGPASGPSGADFNYDGQVTFQDFVILSNNFGLSAAPNFVVSATTVMTATPTGTTVEVVDSPTVLDSNAGEGKVKGKRQEKGQRR
jgi:hypothetical protein